VGKRNDLSPARNLNEQAFFFSNLGSATMGKYKGYQRLEIRSYVPTDHQICPCKAVIQDGSSWRM